MTNSKVQISVRKLEKCRHDGPARHQFLVQEVAYNDRGFAYPFIVEVLETRTAGMKEKQSVDIYLANKYSGRIVTELDMTPVIKQLF